KQKELLIDVEVGSIDDIPSLKDITAEEIMRCIGELPDSYRTVFNLYAVEGYSHREIADLLHIPESTSRSLFFRARQMLQKKVIQLYGVQIMGGIDAIRS